MHIFDTHCHISSDVFMEDRDDIFERMRGAGVARALIAADPADPENDIMTAYELAERHEFISIAVGVHPHNASLFNADAERAIRDAFTRKGFVAVGEIGLDYHYDLSPREVQRDVFDAQLEIAYEAGYPVQLHIREAHGDCMDILRARAARGRLPAGIMHCYTGSWESAKVYLNMGMYISLSGAVTFKNAPKLAEVARNVPGDRLLVETDCPYMAPVPLRGRRNEPAYIVHTVEKIAELRGMDAAETAEMTYQNGIRAFGIIDK